MSGPLSGIRVMDFTHHAVGPWACVLLGEMGADVVKIEPPEGENMRRNPPPYKNGITTTYIAMNVNKWNTAFDLHDEAVRETMHELVRQSDILIENHRPGFLDRRGLSYEVVSKINPRMIYCPSSGYGSRGPYRDMGSVDPYGQAVSGFSSVSGAVGSRPEGVRGGAPADLCTSQFIVAGVLAALYNREITGLGQYVDTSQMQAITALSGARAMEFYASGQNPVPMGSGVGNIVPSRAFRASDGRHVNVSALDEATWQRLCAALGLPVLARDPRLQSNVGRVEHRATVDAALAEVLATQPAERWIATLVAHGVPAGGYLTYNNLRVNAHVRETRMIHDLESPWGRITITGLPWRFSRTPGEIRPTHMPGADSREILEKFAPGEHAPSAADASTPTGRTTPAGPLEGLRVVDITQGYVGYCGMLMADLGATVVKVEPPGGDYLRHLGAPFVGEDAAAFLAVNRSKQSVRLAWQDNEAARGAFDRLVAQADVLLSDLQPREAALHRLDHDTVTAAHPRLVLTSLTPFGDSGPLADQPATELEIQGISGQWRYLGEPGGEPVRMGIPIGGLFAALFAFHGTMAALYERARSGLGQKVEVSQLGSQIAMQTVMWAAESEPDDWIGHCLAKLKPPATGYATGDRSILWGFTYTTNDEALREFCERLGIAEVLDDWNPRNNPFGDDKKDVFEAAFAKHTSDELVGWVRELGGDGVHYHTFESLSKDPQAIALGLVSEYDYPGVGRMGTTGLGWEFSNSPARHGRPPLLGEHTGQVLGGLGLSAENIAALERAAAR